MIAQRDLTKLHYKDFLFVNGSYVAVWYVKTRLYPGKNGWGTINLEFLTIASMFYSGVMLMNLAELRWDVKPG